MPQKHDRGFQELTLLRIERESHQIEPFENFAQSLIVFVLRFTPYEYIVHEVHNPRQQVANYVRHNSMEHLGGRGYSERKSKVAISTKWGGECAQLPAFVIEQNLLETSGHV
jgi:hypothetical protein